MLKGLPLFMSADVLAVCEREEARPIATRRHAPAVVSL
jgi:hypothetical protein